MENDGPVILLVLLGLFLALGSIGWGTAYLAVETEKGRQIAGLIFYAILIPPLWLLVPFLVYDILNEKEEKK